ncbi:MULTISPECIES: hypothetical protein [unclassified Desulfovibrio]|uniref:hypothetical protein n=1 Tax=unclassified Desulfovibrio TaxID=2593640 RepID=UPI001F15496A|nr:MULTISPECIES: hypothetical protein [unclassified Desulfovibrio]
MLERFGQKLLVAQGQTNDGLFGDNLFGFSQSRLNEKIRARTALHGCGAVDGFPD